ncbi:MAG: hypothetical protein SFW35_02690 [Chitinophagales bacterium]|nr:hypothetical protein [Chitinophagales bacterium]
MRSFPVLGDTLRLDTLSLVQGSVLIMDANSNRIDSASYNLDYLQSLLIWKKRPPTDSIRAIYRTFPLSFSKQYANKDVSSVPQTENFLLNPFSYTPESRTGIIDFGNLDYSGSFSRGLALGSNQNVTLNSAFNVQLSGNITQDIEVTAAITDNNIPIQPEGNTQQLQQFDRVFIKVTKKPHTVVVGDYEVGSPRGYFMKFYKNLQGGGYRSAMLLKDSMVLRPSVSLAVSKGKFARNTLNVTEGNQGPYKLAGANGETFIVILAGTERVFVNGILRQRGADRDYVIDYNLGEITFTPNLLITEDLRVIIEFEYSDQNYFRSLVYTNNEFDTKKVKLSLNFYSEQDNKNQPVQADLSKEQKQLLANIGNTSGRAFFPGYSLQDFDANRLLYRLVTDTIVDGVTYDSVFVYTSSNESPLYSLSFSYVGDKLGQYRPSGTTANGRVFEWVANSGGVPQGSYEPVIVLITPRRTQMAVGGMEYAPSKNDLLFAEFALSNNDPNTFSEKDNQANIGNAVKGGYKRKFEFGGKGVNPKDSTKVDLPYQIQAEVNYEFMNHNFNPIERFRPVEFSRNWNYKEAIGDSIDQHLSGASLLFSKPNWGSISYSFNTLQVYSYYTGYMQTVTAGFNNSGYKLDFNISHLQTDVQGLERSVYIRPTLKAEKSFAKLKGWKLGGIYLQEDNKVKDFDTDTLLNSSFAFTDWRVYIASADTAKVKAKFEYIRRTEFRKKTPDEMRLYTVSNTWNANGEWLTNPVSTIKWQLTYRRFDARDSIRQSQELQEYYLGRLEYSLNVLKGAITGNTLYELGAGREQRRDYTYIPVAAGQGNYIWRDYNENGRQEANEFELSSFDEDTMYIRVVNPSNEYDPVNITQFNQVINLNPRVWWASKKGMLGFMGRLSTITSFQIDRRVFRGSQVSIFNPFILDVQEEALLAINSNLRNSVFFNRSSTVYSLEYTFQDNRSKTNLTGGFETRSLREHLVRPRWNIVKPVNLQLKYAHGIRTNTSDVYVDRVYDITYNNLQPELTWLHKNKIRLTLSYSYSNSQNAKEKGGEYAKNHEAAVESRYSIVSKTSITARFAFTNINYSGATDSPLEFAFLQGLKNGKNYQWSVAFDRTIGKNVQLNLLYEGRKTGDARMVHTGRAQIRAIF